MKTIDEKDLIDLLKSDPKIAYVAIATSPWHAIGVVASILSEHLERKKGIILIQISSSMDRPTINSNNFNALSGFVDIFIFTPTVVSSKALRLLSTLKFAFHNHSRKIESRELYIISPASANVYMASQLYYNVGCINICAIAYDEGVGTYFTRSIIKLFEGNRKIIPVASIIMSVICSRIYNKFNKTKNVHLFIRNKEGLTINEEIIPYYKSSVELSVQNNNIDLSVFENTVIICSSAWSRQVISDDIDSALIIRIADYLHTNNINFIIKLHPRDTWGKEHYSKYSKYIYSTTGVSMESILSSVNIKPRLIIGYSTTSLITAKLFWDIPVVNISNILERERLGVSYREEIDEFNKAFGSFIRSPKTFNELINITSL